MPYMVKTPALLKWFYPGLTWHKSRSEKVLYLTFDDGPIPEVTPFVLQILADFKAKATFFCIGDNVQKHPEIFEQVKAGGHSIGNHTFNHLRGWDTADEIYLQNTQKCQELVQSKLFRPPYGRAKKAQFAVLRNQYEVIMWDVLSGDFDPNLSPQKCYQNIVDKSSNGSIVVFHDSLKAWPRTQYALPKALEYWKKQGYQFKTL
ncbi:MAG: polysaccharide deacetylase family protein [Sphingobacteriaceae bacterium]|nr:MAG: polysaccharide deacetylase family protein [Sphingobacteriaceae bacterium]